MRIVFDTNVYVSAFAAPNSKSSFAIRLAARGRFELVSSSAILEELFGKLSGLKFGFSGEELEAAEADVREMVTLVKPEGRLSVLEDEPDNRILECAVESGVAAIVTGDKDLLVLKSYEASAA